MFPISSRIVWTWSVHRSFPFSWLLDHLGKTHRMFSKMFHRLICPDPIVSVTLGKARPCWGISCVPRSVPLCFLPPEPHWASSASSSPLFSVSATFDSRSFLQAGAAIFPKCKLLNKIFCALERPHLVVCVCLLKPVSFLARRPQCDPTAGRSSFRGGLDPAAPQAPALPGCREAGR